MKMNCKYFMGMKEEIADIFNENFELIGQASKSEIVAKGLWCQSFHCWIIRPTSPGYILFQKRASTKMTFPQLYDITCAGHYKAGENIPNGVREIEEELNKKVEFSTLVPLGIKVDIGRLENIMIREFCHVFLLCDDTSPNDYNLGLDEVEGLIEISIKDGLDLFSGNKKEIFANGIVYNNSKKKIEKFQSMVNVSHFIHRIDNYFYKIIILADRYLKGDKHLII